MFSSLPSVRLFSTTTVISAAKNRPRFLGALKKLSELGVEALRPTCVTLADQQQRWKRPTVSRRVAKVLRKQAVRDGTYGSFNDNKGWDPAWDIALAKAQPRGQGRIPQMRVPKKTSRERTREDRARKIEEKMVGMDERIDALLEEKAKKEKESFEDMYKRLVRASTKK